LPGAEREARFLKRQAKTWGLVEEMHIGTQASESALYQLKSPKILHLATHGFFLPEMEIQNPSSFAKALADRESRIRNPASDLSPQHSALDTRHSALLKNPMQRSVLALAGAQITLDAWEKGRVPPTDNDGVVTAQEVGCLDLQGTWIVALSGCDTGSGEARAGEGVLGLRRGFIQAGAENLLMTLWPVGDAQTVQIIQDFYNQALRTGNAPQALADVQRNWLIKLRQESGLSMAVRLAGPFILSFQGQPGR
jgi:CHAT domain-containing protein